MALSLELTDTFYLYVHSKQISCMFQSFVVFLFLLTPCLVAAVQTCMKRMSFFKKKLALFAHQN